jgi:hypothetical protein
MASPASDGNNKRTVHCSIDVFYTVPIPCVPSFGGCYELACAFAGGVELFYAHVHIGTYTRNLYILAYIYIYIY